MKVRYVCDLCSQQYGVPKDLFRCRDCHLNPLDVNYIKNPNDITTPQPDTDHNENNKVNNTEKQI